MMIDDDDDVDGLVVTIGLKRPHFRRSYLMMKRGSRSRFLVSPNSSGGLAWEVAQGPCRLGEGMPRRWEWVPEWWVGPRGVLPPPGRVENAKEKTTRRRRRAVPAGQRTEASGPSGPTPRAAPARARTPHAARASRTSHTTAHVCPGAQRAATHIPPPQQQARPCAPACARATRRARWRGAPFPLSARARSSADRRHHTHDTPGGRGRKRGDHQHQHHHYHPRACVRADLRTRAPIERSDPASCNVAQLARAASPHNRTRLGRTCGGRGGAPSLQLHGSIGTQRRFEFVTCRSRPTCVVRPRDHGGGVGDCVLGQRFVSVHRRTRE